MATCIPIKDLKDTAKFSKLVHSHAEPITITKNGYDDMVVMTSDYYDFLSSQLVKVFMAGGISDPSEVVTPSEKLEARIDLAEEELASGKFIDGACAMAALKEKYAV
jgi:hypothetical protein